MGWEVGGRLRWSPLIATDKSTKFDGLLVNSRMSTWRASYNPVSTSGRLSFTSRYTSGKKIYPTRGRDLKRNLVEKLVGDKLADIRQSISEQRQAVVELTQRLQKLSDVGEKQKEYEAKKQDAEFRLKIFKQHGVEEKLQKQVDF